MHTCPVQRGKMVYKRPFHDEEPYEVARKQQRQEEKAAEGSPVKEITQSGGEDGNGFSISQDVERPTRETVSEYLNEINGELEYRNSGGIPSYLWVNGNTLDEHSESEAAVQLSFFPSYFEFDHQVTALVRPRDIYSVLLEYPPRKLVSVGPDHQADIPEWEPTAFKKFPGFIDESDSLTYPSKSSGSCLMDGDKIGDKLMGTCVIPMPNMESAAYDCCIGWGSGSHCNCIDRDSVGCVRQHVIEARDKLRETLGPERFEELGFCDMGEDVVKNWKEDEELAFLEVVLSNPSSLGKNFWHHLPTVFPSRTRKDLVSYYFNVFMLRKRAEQNRYDPLNVDSDNDEWQRCEVGISEEDDESAIESPKGDSPGLNQEILEGPLEGNPGPSKDDDIMNHRHEGGEEDERDVDDVSKADKHSLIGACGMDPLLQLPSQILNCKAKDRDIQR